jgi:hypothetical protein
MKRIAIFVFLTAMFFALPVSSAYGQLKSTPLTLVDYQRITVQGGFALPPRKYDSGSYRHDYIIRIEQKSVYLRISSSVFIIGIFKGNAPNGYQGRMTPDNFLRYDLAAGEYRISVKPGPQAFIDDKRRPKVFGDGQSSRPKPKPSVEYRLIIKLSPIPIT